MHTAALQRNKFRLNKIFDPILMLTIASNDSLGNANCFSDQGRQIKRGNIQKPGGIQKEPWTFIGQILEKTGSKNQNRRENKLGDLPGVSSVTCLKRIL
jgi:hypothetical protein